MHPITWLRTLIRPHADLDRVVGVLSNGEENSCQGAENDFGALSRVGLDWGYA